MLPVWLALLGLLDAVTKFTFVWPIQTTSITVTVLTRQTAQLMVGLHPPAEWGVLLMLGVVTLACIFLFERLTPAEAAGALFFVGATLRSIGACGPKKVDV